MHPVPLGSGHLDPHMGHKNQMAQPDSHKLLQIFPEELGELAQYGCWGSSGAVQFALGGVGAILATGLQLQTPGTAAGYLQIVPI